MKNLFTAFILAIALAGVSLAQGASKAPRMAVVEFTPGPKASVMTFEAKRHLQASVASSINNTRKFQVVDVRNTRFASQANLAALNGSGSTAAAVKLGKQLDVAYVLTGTVIEYDTKGGQVRMSTRFIEVATGKVKYSGEITHQSTTEIRAGGEAEMMSKVLKPAIIELTAKLTGV